MIRRTVTILTVCRRHSNPRLEKPLNQLERWNTESFVFKEVLPAMKRRHSNPPRSLLIGGCDVSVIELMPMNDAVYVHISFV